MAFELYTKKSTRSGILPSVSVSKQGTLHLNTACMNDHFKDVEFVQLLYDSHGRRIAIRPVSPDDEHTYKVCRGKQGGGHISGQGFLNYYKIPHNTTRAYPAQWDDDPGALVISLGEK